MGWVGGQPMILDVGMPLPESGDTPGTSRHRWRDVYRQEILPKLVKFKPDLILVSAGFDAHKKDTINFGYIGLLEEDYEWVTHQLVQVRHACMHASIDTYIHPSVEADRFLSKMVTPTPDASGAISASSLSV